MVSLFPNGKPIAQCSLLLIPPPPSSCPGHLAQVRIPYTGGRVSALCSIHFWNICQCVLRSKMGKLEPSQLQAKHHDYSVASLYLCRQTWSPTGNHKAAGKGVKWVRSQVPEPSQGASKIREASTSQKIANGFKTVIPYEARRCQNRHEITGSFACCSCKVKTYFFYFINTFTLSMFKYFIHVIFDDQKAYPLPHQAIVCIIYTQKQNT